MKTGVDVTEATHVKVHGRFEKIVSTYGISPEGHLAPPSKGGFGVVTETGRTVSMWEAQSYGKEEVAVSQDKPTVWHSVKDKMPAGNETCWITGPNADYIVGPIVYKAPPLDGWLNLFATPEAGSIFTVANGITHWTEESSINEPEYEEEPGK